MAVTKIGQTDKRLKAECRHCGAILEYMPIDVKRRVHTDYTGCSDEYLSIECPECKTEVSVKRP